MPAYNASSYIVEACNSLLNQSYTNLEVIVVDDASTDGTIAKLDTIKDPRICLLLNTENKGLAASLNTAIRHAKGEYLARMDADDICYPDRINKQVEFLENNPNVSLLGTGLQYFNFSSFKNYFPENHESCKTKLLFNVCFGHSSLMFRRKVFANNNNLYNPGLRQYSEDYELYSRLIDQFYFANLPRMLVRYRTFETSVKSEAVKLRKSNSRAVRNLMLRNMGVPEPNLNLDIHCKAADLVKLNSKKDFFEIVSWFDFLQKINLNTSYFDQFVLQRQLSEQLVEIAYQNYHLGLTFSALKNISFFDRESISFNTKIKYLFKKTFYSASILCVV